MAKKQTRVRTSSPQSRWTRFGDKAPPLDVLIELRLSKGHPAELWRCVEARSSGLFSLEIVRPGGTLWSTSVYDFMQWRFPGGRGMTKEQIANVQRAMKARRSRLKKLEDEAREREMERKTAAFKRQLARQAREAQLPVYRIRRYSGHAGGSNHYHHADVMARDRHEALRAAKEGRVANWRWIDTYDTCDKTYCRYEYLYPLKRCEAKRPAKPLTKTEVRQRKREWKAYLEKRNKKKK